MFKDDGEKIDDQSAQSQATMPPQCCPICAQLAQRQSLPFISSSNSSLFSLPHSLMNSVYSNEINYYSFPPTTSWPYYYPFLHN